MPNAEGLEPASIDWRPPADFPRLWDAKEIAIDTETYDPHLKKFGSGWPRGDGYVVGVALATDGFCGYYPIRHEAGGNLDPEMVVRWLIDVCATPNVRKIFANCQYDVGWLLDLGVMCQGPFIDVLSVAALLDEHRGPKAYDLDSVGLTYAGRGKDETALERMAEEWGLNPKNDLWKLPANAVGGYAEGDARLTLDTWHAQQPFIAEQQIERVLEVESQILPTLIQMRYQGIRVDVSHAESLSVKLQIRGEKLQQELNELVGFELDVNARSDHNSVKRWFDERKIPYPHTAKGNPSFTGPFLESLAGEHRALELLLEIRATQKAKNGFLDTQVLGHIMGGRVHCEWNPLKGEGGGTITGRFSAKHPPLQTVPKTLGGDMRAMFLPEKGETLVAVDYSQQEYRLIVHYAERLKLPGARTAGDFYRDDPTADFHQITADLVGGGITRKAAKAINFGISYGMGVQKLCASLGLDLEAGQKVLDAYHHGVPFVKGLQQRAARQAETRGYLHTPLGRRFRYDLWEPSVWGDEQEDVTPIRGRDAARKAWHGKPLRRAYTYKAVNALVQGTGADMTKLALVELAKAGLTPLLTIHDEFVFSLPDLGRVREIQDIMEGVMELTVPIFTDVKVGKNWGYMDDAEGSRSAVSGRSSTGQEEGEEPAKAAAG